MLKLVLKRLFLILLLINFKNFTSFRTTLNKADPNPLYTSEFPFEPVFDWKKDYMKGNTNCLRTQRISLAASPFMQRANKGTDINKRHAELGDLTGRWNMIATLPFNTLPNSSEGLDTDTFESSSTLTDIPSSTQCYTVNADRLVTIRNNLLTCIQEVFKKDNVQGAYPDQLKSVEGLLSLQTKDELLGYFTVPIKYRKTGVRFHANGVLFGGLGVSCDFGVANVSQTAQFIDLDSTSTCFIASGCVSSSDNCPTQIPIIKCLNPFPTATVTPEQWREVVGCINRQLMSNLKDLTNAIGLNICDYSKTSIEDVQLDLFWRNAFCINMNNSHEWSNFLFVPFFDVGYTFAAADMANPDVAFSLSNGNNGHDEYHFYAGFGLDFKDTIEVGGEAGFVHFKCRDYSCYRVPTNDFQQNIYPYQTNVSVKPGNTWHTSIFMNARHFLEHWNFWGQWVYINHQKDTITLQKLVLSEAQVQDGDSPNSTTQGVFYPQNLECISDWNAQLFNLALNYELTPNFQLGLYTQIPVSRQNAYRSSTFMATLYAAF